VDSDDQTIGGVETFYDISELKNLTTHLEERYKFENIIGRSKVMQKVYVMLENVSQTDSTVLITGESGTGKELVARAIHLNSIRKSKPFVVVNCSAFAESLLESELFGHERGAFTGAIKTKPGHLELAQGGTLFLDEIGDISLPIQVKLLRVLETRKYQRVGGVKEIALEIRLLAATNKNLLEEVKKGNFREDLYYRINVFNIHLPPLRERLSDFPLLIKHFLEKLNNKFNKSIKSINPEVLKILQNHLWYGNIRELENVLEHSFVLCHGPSIEINHLPDWLNNNNHKDISNPTSNSTLKNAEMKVIEETLKKFDGNRKKTASALTINPSTLWRKMKKYDLV
jgi:transcriptional regulator with PAS, ATPase and Fis domain